MSASVSFVFLKPRSASFVPRRKQQGPSHAEVEEGVHRMRNEAVWMGNIEMGGGVERETQGVYCGMKSTVLLKSTRIFLFLRRISVNVSMRV